MTRVLIHVDIFDDIKVCYRKGWYASLGEEMPRICRLLSQDGKLPGERAVHYIKLELLQGKMFHAGINLPKENVGKLQGARIIYAKESLDLVKIIYVGGHRDKRYDESYLQVSLIEERWGSNTYIEFKEDIIFSNT